MKILEKNHQKFEKRANFCQRTPQPPQKCIKKAGKLVPGTYGALKK